jgi:hypothetical protein
VSRLYFEGRISLLTFYSVNAVENASDSAGTPSANGMQIREQTNRGLVAHSNTLGYESNFDEASFVGKLVEFVDYHEGYKTLLASIIEQYARVEICISIWTEYGQFGFAMRGGELAKLASLGLNVNFHFHSLGRVEK